MRGKQCIYDPRKSTTRRVISPANSENGSDEAQNFSPGIVESPKDAQLQLVEPDSRLNGALTNQDILDPAPKLVLSLATSATSFDTVEDIYVDNSWAGDCFGGTRKPTLRSSSFQFNAGLPSFWNNPEPINFELTPPLTHRIELSTEPRRLLRRTMASPVASANGQFILQTLRTYPRMMLRTSTYPPLVHASSTNNQNANTSIEDPLSVCINIIQLFYSKTNQSSPFVWRSIKFEQERLYSQVVSSSRLSMFD